MLGVVTIGDISAEAGLEGLKGLCRNGDAVTRHSMGTEPTSDDKPTTGQDTERSLTLRVETQASLGTYDLRFIH